MRLLLISLLIFGGILFAQYNRYVQVQIWHLEQREYEAKHQFNVLRLKFDKLRQYTLTLEGKQ